MSERNDGGPAFPSEWIKDDSGYKRGDCGMSLRDYFAARAMEGLLAQAQGTAMGSEPRLGAEYAYKMADAMLKAREHKEE